MGWKAPWSLIPRLQLYNMPNQLSYYLRENSCHCELALSCQDNPLKQGSFTRTRCSSQYTLLAEVHGTVYLLASFYCSPRSTGGLTGVNTHCRQNWSKLARPTSFIPWCSAPFPWSLCLLGKKEMGDKGTTLQWSCFSRAIPGQSLHWQQEEENNLPLMLLSQFAWPH